MKLKNVLAPVLVLALVMGAMTAPSVAAKKKKKPKPYTSEEGVVAIGHTLAMSSTGEANSITLNEFEATCAIPATNGIDAFVYEVPAEYQKITSNVAARAEATATWDLYFLMYDKDCKLLPTYLSPTTTIPNTADTEGIMPPGAAYVAITNFAGPPAIVHWEAKP